MTKFEMVSYMASLLTIMQDRDSAGAVSRGPTLGREYEKIYQEYRDLLDKENEDGRK